MDAECETIKSIEEVYLNSMTIENGSIKSSTFENTEANKKQ